MAFTISSVGKIVEDFKESLNQIFGGATNSAAQNKGGDDLFQPKFGGSFDFRPDKWTGNAKVSNGVNARKVKYGFAILNSSNIQASNITKANIYYLDIPPQAITQKEIFASTIEATRRGVIVQTEGVVFKDVLIQGTTGIFPGKRAESNVPQSNLFSKPTQAPGEPAGVDPETGKSRASNVPTLSGYEEFMRLRQFFLRYASEKVASNGDRFLIFINEKDNQELIVEPMEFTMERSSKSPMTYNYRIGLKAIGTLGGIFKSNSDSKNQNGIHGFLEDVGNVSANLSASIQQGRAVINQSTRLLQRFSQALDQTFVGPLRQLQYASSDLRDGVTTVLSLPAILARNATQAVMNIRDNMDAVGSAVSGRASNSSSTRASESATFALNRSVVESINNDSRVPLPRSFVGNLKDTTRDLADNLADFTGLGDADYNSIYGRTVTFSPEPLKLVSDDEFILLGTLHGLADSMNSSLASNVMYESDAEIAFEQAQSQFQIDGLKDDQQIKINRPDFVKEVTIARNDTLERIAQREYGDALRWLDIVVLNNLKPPYISTNGEDGTKQPGEKILVGVS